MDLLGKIIGDIETHSVVEIRSCFEQGLDPNILYNNQPLIYELTSEYLRSINFKECVRAFVDYGLNFPDELLLSVLLDDKNTLEKLLKKNPGLIETKYSLRSAFTPLFDASLLHICAEFNHVASAEVLVNYGIDINARAGIDENGLGGQSPIFHTVNQILNQSRDMLEFLLDRSADLMITVPGFIWGKRYQWETLIPSVNPISYAMMGLIPQMHRNESTIAKTVSVLLEAAYGIKFTPTNIPNAYLKS